MKKSILRTILYNKITKRETSENQSPIHYKGEIIMKNITNNTELNRNLNGGHWLWDVVQWLWEKFPEAYSNACKPKPKVSAW